MPRRTVHDNASDDQPFETSRTLRHHKQRKRAATDISRSDIQTRAKTRAKTAQQDCACASQKSHNPADIKALQAKLQQAEWRIADLSKVLYKAQAVIDALASEKSSYLKIDETQDECDGILKEAIKNAIVRTHAMLARSADW